MIEAGASTPKFVPGLPVSDHPAWKLQLGAGIAFAGLIFLLAGFATQGRSVEPAQLWPGIALIAASGGSLIGLSAEKLVLESITPRDWLFGGARLATMVAIVLAGTWAVAQRQPAARLAGLFTQAGSGMTLPRLLDGLLLALAFFTVQSASVWRWMPAIAIFRRRR